MAQLRLVTRAWIHNPIKFLLHHFILKSGVIMYLSFSHSLVFDSFQVDKKSPWTAAHQGSLFFTISRSLLKLMSIESVIPSNHFILSSLSLPAFNLFQHQVFSNELALHIRWTKDQSFSFSISPSNEYSGLVSFKIDQVDILEV